MHQPHPALNTSKAPVGRSFILEELSWIKHLLNEKFEKKSAEPLTVFTPPKPDETSEYGKFILAHDLSTTERCVLALALLPHIDPYSLTILNTQKEKNFVRRCPESGVLQPTVFSVAALLCANDDERSELRKVFKPAHLFYRKSVLQVSEPLASFPEWSGGLVLAQNYVSLFLDNEEHKPRFSAAFPASLVTTHLAWGDLVLNHGTHNKLQALRDALSYHDLLRQEHDAKHIKKGMRVLFHGPSGTGKTLTTALLGKEMLRDVYRVDLSAVVSKYIGETTKNLSALFNTAENKDWILFFDEGDALFGKRSDSTASENKNVHYANQDIAYLLQRIEDYNGLIIIASNFHKNMDEAFYRRIEHSIHFGIPDNKNRERLWQEMLPKGFTLPVSHPVEMLSKHNITAATIARILTRVCVQAMADNRKNITAVELDKSIQMEMYA